MIVSMISSAVVGDLSLPLLSSVTEESKSVDFWASLPAQVETESLWERGSTEIRGLSPHIRDEICKQFHAGEKVGILAARFDRSPSTIRRVVILTRLLQLRQLSIEWIDNPEFPTLCDSDRETFLGDGPAATVCSTESPKNLPAYLACLYDVPLLTPQREVHLFRKMNYLLFLARQLQLTLDPEHPRTRTMDQLEQYLAEAAVVRNEIIAANLRLVLPIAKRYMRPGWDFFELVSEGNMSLIRAVEKFDFARGYKFSTYAVWTIVKNFTRSITYENRYHGRFCTGFDEHLNALAEEPTDPEEIEQAVLRSDDMIRKILGHLDPREYEVIIHRFGLSPDRECLTLKQIGQRIGVSKERVRQIESRALGKLRAEAMTANRRRGGKNEMAE